jgi:ribosomal protein S10
MSAARPLSQKRVYLMFNGWDQRMFPFVEHIAWAAKQIPTMRVTGPVPLPRQDFRRTVLSSPFKFGSARETWERRSHKRLIVYETDARTHAKFQKFLLSVMEPMVAVRIAEHSFHPVENFFRKELFQGVSSTKH